MYTYNYWTGDFYYFTDFKVNMKTFIYTNYIFHQKTFQLVLNGFRI